MKYSIIQTNSATYANNFKATFEIIRGQRAGGGYPMGFEGKDWFRTEHQNLTIEKAREILEELNN